MNILEMQNNIDAKKVGLEMYELMTELYPICRSITGAGVRETLDILRRFVPIEVKEIPTGTQVFDWTVPKEWNIRDAFVKNSQGEKIIDFQKSNLHVLNYSVPVRKKVTLQELREHLYTIPEHPEWIPYRTSYYDENWGFCISQNQFNGLQDGAYEVCIDSSLQDGHLTYGEFYVQGQTSDEILISTHICHPSMCNDNLSGIVLAVFLAKHLSQSSLRYSYRFLFAPGTIGAITWLSRNESRVSKVKHGLVVACVGDSGGFTYKKSRQGNAVIDTAVKHVLEHSGSDSEIEDFSPHGYDERQFCSPGFNLPIGRLTRTPHGQFPQYHTSADNLDLVRPENLSGSFSLFLSILDLLEGNRKYLNCKPKCEPQLGKRGLYHKMGGYADSKEWPLAMLWVLNLSDGEHTLLDIAERAHLDFELLRKAADTLQQHGLLKECVA